jgi:acetylxylan esterase
MLLKPILVLASAVGIAFSASLQSVSNFGTNPTKINMYIYVPDKVATKPAVIVAVLHPNCPKLIVSLM